MLDQQIFELLNYIIYDYHLYKITKLHTIKTNEVIQVKYLENCRLIVFLILNKLKL